MGINDLLKNEVQRVKILCSVLNIEELYFFGSSTNENFDLNNSDIDIYVCIKKENLKNLPKLEKGLRNIFNRKIDTFCSLWKLHPELKSYIDKNKVNVYKKQNRY